MDRHVFIGYRDCSSKISEYVSCEVDMIAEDNNVEFIAIIYSKKDIKPYANVIYKSSDSFAYNLDKPIKYVDIFCGRLMALGCYSVSI